MGDAIVAALDASDAPASTRAVASAGGRSRHGALSSQHANAVGALYALTAFAIYSTHDVVVKFLGGTYSPFQIVFFSTLFGFPIVTVMLMRDREDGNLRPGTRGGPRCGPWRRW